MSNIKKKNIDIILWLLWLALVILWNFGYPNAKPILDVTVAIILSMALILIKKLINF